MALLVIAGFMLFVTFFGQQFGASLAGIGEGVSRLLSPQIRPTIAPTIGLEFTPGVWEWWRSASAFFEAGGFAQWFQFQLPYPTGDNNAGGDNGAGGLGGIPVIPSGSPIMQTIEDILKWRP